MHIQYYRDLLVWQKAMDLCTERCGEVGRMLNGLIDALERRLASS